MDTTAPTPDDDGATAAINDVIAPGPADAAFTDAAAAALAGTPPQHDQEVGGEALGTRLAEDEQRRERQRVGLERAVRLVDVDALLGDQAWR